MSDLVKNRYAIYLWFTPPDSLFTLLHPIFCLEADLYGHIPRAPLPWLVESPSERLGDRIGMGEGQGKVRQGRLASFGF